MSVFLVVIDFIHEVQKERGLTALYLCAQEVPSAEEMEMQFIRTDKIAAQLLPCLHAEDAPTLVLQKALHALSARRRLVAARLADAEAVAQAYTRELIAPAVKLVSAWAIGDKRNHPARASALLRFLLWKERIGQERAFGLQALTREAVDQTVLITRLRHLVDSQQAFERMFLGLADEEQRAQYFDIKARNPVFQVIDKMNDAISDGRADTVLAGYSALEWFNIFSAKIDLLHEASRLMAGHLADDPPFSAAVCGPEARHLESALASHLDAIEGLPLFAGVDEATRYALLRDARIVYHDKGCILLTQGEPLTRFYCVLDGWVKVFNGNAEGQESVLQILGCGENIFGANLTGHGLCPAYAQAVDNVKLLSLSSTIVREILSRSRALAANLFAATAAQSQDMLNHIEQLTLRSAAQRVGWFLLRQHLLGDQDSLDIKLPFDKALIASYLGIKPETFSRTLQTFREDGFAINRQTLIMPDAYALCANCNLELAQKCSLAGTERCTNVVHDVQQEASRDVSGIEHKVA